MIDFKQEEKKYLDALAKWFREALDIYSKYPITDNETSIATLCREIRKYEKTNPPFDESLNEYLGFGLRFGKLLIDIYSGELMPYPEYSPVQIRVVSRCGPKLIDPLTTVRNYWRGEGRYKTIELICSKLLTTEQKKDFNNHKKITQYESYRKQD